MAESNINLTEGSGKRQHTWDRTISSTLVQDAYTLPGEYPHASYFIQASGISVATSSDHVLQIMAGSSLNLYIRKIHVEQATAATTANPLQLIVLRLTTAGSGGSSITPRRFQLADSAAGCTAQSLPSSKGTESDELFRRRMYLTQTTPTGGNVANQWEWVQSLNQEAIRVASGTSNGLAVKVASGIAGATVDVTVELVELSY